MIRKQYILVFYGGRHSLVNWTQSIVSLRDFISDFPPFSIQPNYHFSGQRLLWKPSTVWLFLQIPFGKYFYYNTSIVRTFFAVICQELTPLVSCLPFKSLPVWNILLINISLDSISFHSSCVSVMLQNSLLNQSSLLDSFLE